MNRDASAEPPKNWSATLQEMQRDWDRLVEEVTRLRAEREMLSKALYAKMFEDVEMTEEEILAQIGREQPLREMLDDLEKELVGG